MTDRSRKINLLLVLILIGGLSLAWFLGPLIAIGKAEDPGNGNTLNAAPDSHPSGVGTLGAGTDPWTTVASAGTVDEADMSIVDLTGALAQIKSSATLPAVLNIRYNVVSEGGIYGGDGYRLTARFRDNGTSSRIRLYLKEYNLLTGITTTRMTLDSNDFPPSNGYQTQTVGNCAPGWAFDFNNKAYFIETSIQKTDRTGNPGLGGIQISYNLC